MKRSSLILWVALLSLLFAGCADTSGSAVESPEDTVVSEDETQAEVSVENAPVASVDAESVTAEEPQPDAKTPEEETADTVTDEDSDDVIEVSDTVETTVEDVSGETDNETTQEEEEEKCVSDPGCSLPGIFGCGAEPGSILICEEVEFACFHWKAWDNCPGDQVCEDGSCLDGCLPNCPPNWCGEDGCGGTCGPCMDGNQVCLDNWCEADGDGDGVPATLDCDDNDPLVYPGGTEEVYDGKDNDCDASTSDGDADGDGAICTCMGGDDCDDDNANIYPLATDLLGDEQDMNCDGHDGTDLDGDSYASIDSGGTDCDDGVATTNPGTGDPWGDGIDSNCDGVDGFAPPPLPDGKICILSGQQGEIISCPMQVARYSTKGPKPVGLSGVFSYHASKVSLLGAFSKNCQEGNCDEAFIGNGSDISTGHTWNTYPAGTTDDPFAGKVAWVLLHPASYDVAISDAVQDPNLTVSGDMDVFWLRFSLKADIAEDAPASVVMTQIQGLSGTLESKTATIDNGLMVVYP